MYSLVHRQRVAVPPSVLALLAVAILSCVAIGYHRGVLDGERDYRQQVEYYTLQASQIGKKNDQCKAELNRRLFDTENAKELADVLKTMNELTREKAVLQAEIASLQDSAHTCGAAYETLMVQAASGNEEAALLREVIEEIEEEVNTLRASLHGLSDGTGTFAVMMVERLKTLRMEYSKMCASIPMCVVLSNAELRRKWANASVNLQGLNLSAAVNGTHTAEAPVEVSAWKYSEDESDAVGIFFPPTGDEAPVLAPHYFDRVGNSVVVGNVLSDDGLAVDTTVSRLAALGDYALCAYRHNNSNFTFPKMFYWGQRDEAALADLDDLIDTPLVRLCLHCTMIGSEEDFRAACHKDVAQMNYGSRDFWVARSLVPAASRLEASARRYVAALNRDEVTENPPKILAVVMHNTNEAVAACAELSIRSSRRGPHYQYLLKAFPDIVSDGTENRTAAECFPSTAQIEDRIYQILDSEFEESGTAFDVIYVSLEPHTLRELKASSNAWWKSLLFSLAAPKSARDELLDLLIASSATSILVSPYLAPSQFVTETYLLRNRFKPPGKVYFF